MDLAIFILSVVHGIITSSLVIAVLHLSDKNRALRYELERSESDYARSLYYWRRDLK